MLDQEAETVDPRWLEQSPIGTDDTKFKKSIQYRTQMQSSGKDDRCVPDTSEAWRWNRDDLGMLWHRENWAICVGVQGILNQHGFNSILKRHFIPSKKQLIGHNFILITNILPGCIRII